MKTTKFFKLLLLCLTLSFAAVGCDDYDDSALREEIENINSEIGDIKSQLETLKGQVSSVQTILDTQNGGKVITNVEAQEDGKTYILTFNDGTSIEVVRGGNESQVTVVEERGTYYWAVMTNGQSEPILDSAGEKIPFSDNADAISVDTEGCLLMDGKRVTDGNGDSVKLSAGSAIFTDIVIEDEQVTFTLGDSKVVIPRKTGTFLTFEHAVTEPYTLFAGIENQVPVRISKDMQLVEVIKDPDGWTVKLNREEGYVTVTPAGDGSGSDSNEIRLQGIDENGLIYLAVAQFQIVDFSDPQGAFVLNEGNMTSENGSLIYITPGGQVIDNAYKRINGTELGNVCQDMYFHDGKIYIISQNGDADNPAGVHYENDGMLIVVDAKTLKKEKAFSKQQLSQLDWPTHIAVIDEQHVYIRDNAGIWRLDTTNGSLSPITLANYEAPKAPFAVVNGKVYTYYNGRFMVGLYEISPESDTANQIYSGNPFYTYTKIYGIAASDDGQVWIMGGPNESSINISKYNITEKTYTSHPITMRPVLNWDLSGREFVAYGNLVYYLDGTSLYRLDFETGTEDFLVDLNTLDDNAWESYNGIGVNPANGWVYANTIRGVGNFFTTNQIWVFDPSNFDTPKFKFDNYTHFPAGIFFNNNN